MAYLTLSLKPSLGIPIILLTVLLSIAGCESQNAQLAAAKEEVRSVGGSIFEYDDGAIHYDLREGDLKELHWGKVMSLSELRSVAFIGPQFSDEYVSYLTDSASLTSIACAYTNITDDGVAKLRSARNLKLLDLSGCQVTDACIPDLLAIESLEKLYISATPISLAGARKLAQRFSVEWSQVPSEKIRQALGHLEQDGVRIGISSVELSEGPSGPPKYHIHANFNELVPKQDNPERLFDNLALLGSAGQVYLILEPSALAYLKPNSKIYSLSLVGPAEGAEHLFDIEEFSPLATLLVTDLSLSFSNDLPPHVFQVLTDVEGLEELTIFDETISPEDWKQLTSCPKLKMLEFGECQFDDLDAFEPTARPLEMRLFWMEHVSQEDQVRFKELTRTSTLFDDE